MKNKICDLHGRIITGREKDLTRGKGQWEAWEGRAKLGQLTICSMSGRRVDIPFPFPSLSSPSRPRLCHSLSPSIPLQFVMTTPHVIASSSTHTSQPATTTGVVGNHFRVGKKIGEGSFGVVFEGISFSYFFSFIPCSVFAPSGANLLTNQPVAIKFVSASCSESNARLGSGRRTGTSKVGRASITR